MLYTSLRSSSPEPGLTLLPRTPAPGLSALACLCFPKGTLENYPTLIPTRHSGPCQPQEMEAGRGD